MNHSKLQPDTHHPLAWVVILTSALFFFYEFIQMNLFNAINNELRETFHLDAIQLGQLFSMYFYANFICLFPAGNLLDRFSTKKLLLFAVTICTVGTFMFAIAASYWLAATGRFFIGIGASFCFLSCIRLASRWFPPKQMALVTGVVVTMAMLGGLVAQTPFSLLINYLGSWRQALLCNTVLGIFIIFIMVLFIQDYPPNTQSEVTGDQKHLKKLGLWHCIKIATLNPQNWYGGLYTSLINLPVFILGGLWGILYLTNVHHMTNTEASYATTVFFIGVILGSLAFGWFSDYIERRVLPMIIGAVLSLLIIMLLLYLPNLSIKSIIYLFFLIGFVTSSQVLTYPAIAELNPTYLTSTAVSIDSLCIMASGFIVPSLFGWLMEQNGSHPLTKDIAIYTAQDFNRAMLIIPIAFIIGLLITVFMRETYCKSQV
jgi:MFS family permease